MAKYEFSLTVEVHWFDGSTRVSEGDTVLSEISTPSERQLLTAWAYRRSLLTWHNSSFKKLDGEIAYSVKLINYTKNSGTDFSEGGRHYIIGVGETRRHLNRKEELPIKWKVDFMK